MTRPAQFDRDILAQYPKLLGYARKHARTAADAEDCAHEAIVRALVAWEQFKPGTNFGAWLLTICQHGITDMRRGWRLVFTDEDFDGAVSPVQELAVEVSEIAAWISKRSSLSREILLLAAAEHTQEETMRIAGIAHIGTVRSRLSRTRAALREAMAA